MVINFLFPLVDNKAKRAPALFPRQPDNMVWVQLAPWPRCCPSLQNLSLVGGFEQATNLIEKSQKFIAKLDTGLLLNGYELYSWEESAAVAFSNR